VIATPFTGPMPGIMLTALGATAMMGGLMALFVGGSKDSDGALIGGGIALGVGAAITVPGAYLWITSGQGLEVKATPGLKLSLGPCAVGGTF